ncbi:hypothetical protein F5Y15DRAFT_355312 [Xylariaceae sp. FL0016]|nr:hypothetical protein F5Y15DRAFT_355312 [Xylariaceae sp. FL0016]
MYGTWRHDSDDTTFQVKDRPVAFLQACHNCRKAKIKCSGEKTGCNRCRMLERSCVYVDNRSTNRNRSRSRSVKRVSFTNTDTYIQEPQKDQSNTPRWETSSSTPPPAAKRFREQPDFTANFSGDEILSLNGHNGVPGFGGGNNLMDLYNLSSDPSSASHRTLFPGGLWLEQESLYDDPSLIGPMDGGGFPFSSSDTTFAQSTMPMDLPELSPDLTMDKYTPSSSPSIWPLTPQHTPPLTNNLSPSCAPLPTPELGESWSRMQSPSMQNSRGRFRSDSYTMSGLPSPCQCSPRLQLTMDRIRAHLSSKPSNGFETLKHALADHREAVQQGRAMLSCTMCCARREGTSLMNDLAEFLLILCERTVVACAEVNGRHTLQRRNDGGSVSSKGPGEDGKLPAELTEMSQKLVVLQLLSLRSLTQSISAQYPVKQGEYIEKRIQGLISMALA